MNAVLSYVSRSDLLLAGRLRGWPPPRWLRCWMAWATRIGDGWAWLAAGPALAAAGPWGRRVLVAGLVAAAAANAAIVVLKRTCRRPRPADYLPNSLFEAVGAAEPFAFDRFSFPSGHTLNAFAIGTVLAYGFPAAGPLLVLLASSIAASRVVLGQHYVSDVAAGALIGTLIGVGTASWMLA